MAQNCELMVRVEVTLRRKRKVTPIVQEKELSNDEVFLQQRANVLKERDVSAVLQINLYNTVVNSIVVLNNNCIGNQEHVVQPLAEFEVEPLVDESPKPPGPVEPLLEAEESPKSKPSESTRSGENVQKAPISPSVQIKVEPLSDENPQSPGPSESPTNCKNVQMFPSVSPSAQVKTEVEVEPLLEEEDNPPSKPSESTRGGENVQMFLVSPSVQIKVEPLSDQNPEPPRPSESTRNRKNVHMRLVSPYAQVNPVVKVENAVSVRRRLVRSVKPALGALKEPSLKTKMYQG